MTEFYVAFSKHGTNCFITASKQFQRDANGASFMLDGYNFTRARSRTSSLRGAIKLHTSEISNNSTPQEVLSFFDKLKASGWIVNDTGFIARNSLTRMVINDTPKVVVEDSSHLVQNSIASDINSPQTDTVLGVMQINSTNELQAPTPVTEKSNLQPLGPMQQQFKSILDNIWAIQNEVTLPQMKHLLDSSYQRTMSPSDMKRVLVGLANRNLIKFNGEVITRA